MSPWRSPLLVSVGLFVLFFAYYYQTSNHLPIGAGPDNAASNDAVRFIRDHGRLAVIPHDADKLTYTVYGSTRALRPPLSYASAALLTRALESTGLPPEVLYRKGSVLLCALAVAVTFYALFVYFASVPLALAGAVLIGLMPQFAFIGSYNNDDSGAVFAGALMVASLVLIYRRGLNLRRAALLGLAGGLVILSKPTAWLLAPTVALFLVLFVRLPWRRLAIYTAVAALIAFFAGGWWLAFNIHHYGPGDPFARKIAIEHAETMRRLPDGLDRSYGELGFGMYDILVRNHDNFWPKTLKSTVGKLDWLRLDVGLFQDVFYFSFFALGLAYYLLRAARLGLATLRSRTEEADVRRFLWESVLFFAVVFQVFMYSWRQVHTEIQLQGKYLLPAFLPLWLLSLSGLAAATAAAAAWLQRRGITSLRLPLSRLDARIPLGIVTVALLAHVYAFLTHVVPFYRPPLYVVKVGHFEPVPVKPASVLGTNEITALAIGNDTMRFESTGHDPWLLVDPAVCRHLNGVMLLRFVLTAEHDDTFQVFVDRGRGFNEEDSSRVTYRAGESEVHVAVAAHGCHGLRLDPATVPGTLSLRNLSRARLAIAPPE